MLYILLFTSTSFVFSSKGCLFNDSQFIAQSSINSIGDTISIDDQNLIYPICNEGDDNDYGVNFQFSDLKWTFSKLSASYGAAILVARMNNEVIKISDILKGDNYLPA